MECLGTQWCGTNGRGLHRSVMLVFGDSVGVGRMAGCVLHRSVMGVFGDSVGVGRMAGCCIGALWECLGTQWESRVGERERKMRKERYAGDEI